jgi:hypothetical protein
MRWNLLKYWLCGALLAVPQVAVSLCYTGTADSSATFKYWLQDANGVDLHGDSFSLTSDQYAAWGAGSDAAYIQACLLANVTAIKAA